MTETRMSAFTNSASFSAARSLSMTASIPLRRLVIAVR